MQEMCHLKHTHLYTSLKGCDPRLTCGNWQPCNGIILDEKNELYSII